MLSDADSSNPVLAASVNMRLLQLIDATRETTSSPLAEVSTTNRPHHTPNGQGDTFRPRRQPESDPTALTHAPSGASADASRTMRRDGAETTRLVVISLAGNGQPVASLTTQNGDVIHITDESDCRSSCLTTVLVTYSAYSRRSHLGKGCCVLDKNTSDVPRSCVC